MGEMRNAYKILVGKPEGKKQLRWPWRRWEDNIRMDLREIGWEGVHWMHMAHERVQYLAISWLPEWLVAYQGLYVVGEWTNEAVNADCPSVHSHVMSHVFQTCHTFSFCVCPHWQQQ
jgi:hypothetical protein